MSELLTLKQSLESRKKWCTESYAVTPDDQTLGEISAYTLALHAVNEMIWDMLPL